MSPNTVDLMCRPNKVCSDTCVHNQLLDNLIYKNGMPNIEEGGKLR